MALSISSSLVQCSNTFLSYSNQSCNLRSSAQLSRITPASLRFCRIYTMNKSVIRAASSSAAGSSSSNSEFNPYEILGVSPIYGFDKIKEVYARKKKDAERSGDEALANRLESAYDQIMMAQLMKRKKGETFGSFKVSKDIKFADKLPVVPWGPRFAKSEDKDIKINMAISALFAAWIFFTRSAEWKPIQFLGFAFVYRIFEKLKLFESVATPTLNEYGEDESKTLRMGKRLLRSLALVFGCMTVASVGYTGVLNLMESTAGYIPRFLYYNQEMLVTISTAVGLFILASFYR